MGTKFIFQYVNIQPDVSKSKFILKNNSSNVGYVFAFIFGGHKNNFWL